MVENFKTFDSYKVYEYELAGRPLVIETGKIAGLANGACLVRYGETSVLCTATASEKPREGIDFLPLSVDYEERLYAVGKIPGGFLKREGKQIDWGMTLRKKEVMTMTTIKNEKLTYVTALTYAIENGNLPAEIAEKLIALRTQQEKRNTGEKKPTKTQQENEPVKQAIVTLLKDSPSPLTASDVAASVGVSVQKASALLSQLVTAGLAQRVPEMAQISVEPQHVSPSFSFLYSRSR